MKSNAEIAILSLIAESPRHGYEIEQVIEARGMRDWTEVGFSSIYYLLKKLEGAGLVEASLEDPSGGGPTRKVYHITQTGQEVWHAETLRALSDPQNCYPLIQLGLANLPGIPRSEVISALKRYIANLERRRDYVQARREVQLPLPDHVEAMFDLSLTMIEAELGWINNFIRQLEEKMEKVDYKKEMKHLFNPPRDEYTFVDVPEMKFLMIDGQGDPNKEPAYQEAVEALYAMSYAIKFALKGQGFDYVVPPLEGLWWAENMSAFILEEKDKYLWTMMVMQPEQVTLELVERLLPEVKPKKDLPSLERLRLEKYHEGLAVQIMYFGPYADEGPTISQMHAFIKDVGFEPTGKHHEVYLGDPRRTAPEKLKTVIRQPVMER